jgi:hypothetical protein
MTAQTWDMYLGNPGPPPGLLAELSRLRAALPGARPAGADGRLGAAIAISTTDSRTMTAPRPPVTHVVH